MRTRTKGILTILTMLIGAVLITAGPAAADGKKAEEDNKIYSSYTICHYKTGQFPYWATLELSPEDTAWYLTNYPNDYKTEQGCPQNDAVKICKQIDGWWDTAWVDPGSANWLLETGQAKLVEDCKNDPEPQPTPEPTPEPTPTPEQPTPTPEQPEEEIVPVIVEEETPEPTPVVEEEKDEKVEAEAPKPQPKAAPETLGETQARSELALTGASTSDLAGYALLLIGSGVALTFGARRLRGVTV